MADETQAAPPKPTLQVSTAINATDHGQVVVLAGWICLLIGIVLSAVRVYVRWPLNALAGKDDIAYTIAFLLAIIQTAITLDAVKNSFGRVETELEESQTAHTARAIYATDLIFLLSLWTGKLSVSLLFTRLVKESNKVRLGWMLTTMTSVFSIVSILSNAFRRNISQPWMYESDDVSANRARWIATGVFCCILTDLVVKALAFSLVWKLQMRSNSKSLVITAFALRLFVAPVTIVRLVSLGDIRADDLLFTCTLPAAMTQLEMYCNLVAATLPCLRPFFAAWNTNFMDIRLEEIDNNAFRQHVTSHSDPRSKGSASRPPPGGSSRSHGSDFALWAPGDSSSKGQVETGGRKDDTDAASDSSERGIVVKTTVDVTNDHRSPWAKTCSMGSQSD